MKFEGNYVVQLNVKIWIVNYPSSELLQSLQQRLLSGRTIFQGDVHIRDADYGAEKLQIEVFLAAPSHDALNRIAVNQTHFDIGPSVTFVLQLVSLSLSTLWHQFTARCEAKKYSFIPFNALYDRSYI